MAKRTYSVAVMLLLFDIVGLAAIILLFMLYLRKLKELKQLMRRNGIVDAEDRAQDSNKNQSDHYGLSKNSNTSLSTNSLAPTESNAGTSANVSHVSNISNSNNFKTMIRDATASTIGSSSSSTNVNSVQERGAGGLIFLQENQERFELHEMLKASAKDLGKGVFGNTYKAVMHGKEAVVVKRLRDLKPMSGEEFMKKLKCFANHNHPNLLSLLAYYVSKDEKLFVYRFAEKGSLFTRIHGGRKEPDRIPFRWSARLLVAVAVARALEYLHNNSNAQTVVPHGDLKSTNVLIDSQDNILVADYGLSSLLALPIASQRMVAYKSPEYQSTKRVSKKSDMWSYGCLLLELLTGRISVLSSPSGTSGVDLCGWVHKAVREEWTAEIFDSEMLHSKQRRGTGAGMLRLLDLAIKCCDKVPENRPDIGEVVEEVESVQQGRYDDGEDDSSSFDQSLTDESISGPHLLV